MQGKNVGGEANLKGDSANRTTAAGIVIYCKPRFVKSQLNESASSINTGHLAQLAQADPS